MIDLGGAWDFSDVEGGNGCRIDLPGDAITSLNKAGLIPDPYPDRNEYDLRWIGERDWIARRSVTLDDPACELVISGVDTIADVAVNGQTVLQTRNAFREYRADLEGVARAGENEIVITFRSPVREAARLQSEQPFYVPYHKGNCPIPHGNMLRKPQCDFGWDWNIALAPFGVWGDLRIEPKRAGRLTSVEVDQLHDTDQVTLVLTARIDGDAEGDTVTFQFGGARAQSVVAGRTATVRIIVEQPELWWPAGQGLQPLYDLKVTLGEQALERRIGLRQIELVTTLDERGSGFLFRVNGRDVFAKGANWIPADALSGRITEAAVEDLLNSAVAAHMNMIRVWGGGRYEPDWFYDLCDELGLMVWQDFMFACHLYPSTTDFLDEVAREVSENALRLHHHACIALWCGDNELVGMLNEFPESRANRDRYLVSYDRLNRTIETALKGVVPQANWWPSSPSHGPMSYGDAWHDDSAGDMHVWSVWHEGKDFEAYREFTPRFCSEFGFQSFPSLDVIRRFAEPADFNIASPAIESHQKNQGGNARIAETMFRYFRFPVDFANFVYLSQVQQGLAIKTAVDHWRSLKPNCMGTLYWQLNDTWPCASWSSLDHGGGWKLLHHMARRFYAPVNVVVTPDGGTFRLFAINDLPRFIDLTAVISATDVAGRTRPLGDVSMRVQPSSSMEVMRLDASELAEGEMIALVWHGPDGPLGGDLFVPEAYKSYDLQDPGITSSIDKHRGLWFVRLEAMDALGLFVAVEADCPGRFDMNAFALFPGHPVTISFTPADSSAKPDFTIRDLYSATYGGDK